MAKQAFIKSRENLLKFLCLSGPQFEKMVRRGCPGRTKGLGYNLLAICKWIYQQPLRQGGIHKEECLKVVREVIAKNRIDQKTFNEALAEPEPKPASPPAKKSGRQTASKQIRTEKPEQSEQPVAPKDRLELDEALEATKVYIRQLKEQIDSNAKDTGELSGDDLANWSKTLLALNEAAKKTTKNLSERRKLVRIDDVQNYLAGMLNTLRTIFLNLPNKLAPVLENQTSGKIQKLLDEEIRNALEYARNYD